MSGSGSGRKKEMRGSVDFGGREGGPSEGEGGRDGGTVPSWRNGFLGSDIVVADWAEKEGERRGLNEARK